MLQNQTLEKPLVTDDNFIALEVSASNKSMDDEHSSHDVWTVKYKPMKSLKPQVLSHISCKRNDSHLQAQYRLGDVNLSGHKSWTSSRSNYKIDFIGTLTETQFMSRVHLGQSSVVKILIRARYISKPVHFGSWRSVPMKRDVIEMKIEIFFAHKLVALAQSELAAAIV